MGEAVRTVASRKKIRTEIPTGFANSYLIAWECRGGEFAKTEFGGPGSRMAIHMPIHMSIHMPTHMPVHISKYL